MEAGWYGRPAGTVKRGPLRAQGRGRACQPQARSGNRSLVIDRFVGRNRRPEPSVVHGCAEMVPGADTRSRLVHGCAEMARPPAQRSTTGR
jgi:hypothetical protein